METKNILKQLRESRKLTMQDVAASTDISYSVYQKYESGARGVGVPALCKLADFYNVTTDYLLGRDTQLDSTDTTKLDKIKEHIDAINSILSE